MLSFLNEATERVANSNITEGSVDMVKGEMTSPRPRGWSMAQQDSSSGLHDSRNSLAP